MKLSRAARAAYIAVLSTLDHHEMANYLRAKGWRVECDFPGKGELWIFAAHDGEEFFALLPVKREFGDYDLRMSEVVHALADAEDHRQ